MTIDKREILVILLCSTNVPASEVDFEIQKHRWRLEEIMPVVLKSAVADEPDYVCDTVSKAVGSLDKIGTHMMWGVFITLWSTRFLLVYQAEIYAEDSNKDQELRLPFSGVGEEFRSHLETLLQSIFNPFLHFEGNEQNTRSIIEVKQDLVDERRFAINLCLVLRVTERDKEITQTIKDSSVTFGNVVGMWFCD